MHLSALRLFRATHRGPQARTQHPWRAGGFAGPRRASPVSMSCLFPAANGTTRTVASVAEPVSAPSLIFRQLFEGMSSTYTYLLGDPATKECILIDPVLDTVARDLQLVDDLGLTLTFAVNTHCHADHVTGTGKIKSLRPDVRSAIAAAAGAAADVLLRPGDSIPFGGQSLEVRATPGHTSGCVTYVLRVPGGPAMAFTGDALLARGCGRTDFQGGSAETLFASVRTQIFSLPDSTVVYPAHDYKGYTSTTVGEEKAHNPRLGVQKSEAEFVAIMAALNLPYPRQIDAALPANLKCGVQD